MPTQWDPINDPIDFFLLASEPSPGIATIHGSGSERRWNVLQGYGLSGGTAIFTGLKLSEFEAKIRLYTPADWDDWHAWKPLVDKPPIGRRPKSLDIWHPLLAENGIESVVVKNVTQPEQTDDGEWTITIDFLQYRRPKFRLSKPEASKQKEVTDPYSKIIENMTGQLNALANEPP